MESEETEEKCPRWCRGFTLDWTGTVRPCGSCKRFKTDGQASTAARAFMDLFPGQKPDVKGRSAEEAEEAEECGPDCRGWDIFNQSGIRGVEDAIEDCMGCAVFKSGDDVLLAAQQWFLKHLAMRPFLLRDEPFLAEFRRQRAFGNDFRLAVNNAKARTAFVAQAAIGRACLMTEPDGDGYDFSHVGEARAHKAISQRVDREGVWGIVGKFRASSDDAWQDADSVWGFIGRDWQDSGYDDDVRRSVLAALDKVDQRSAEELASRATYAGVAA